MSVIRYDAGETDEQTSLRSAVRDLGARYGMAYTTEKVEAGQPPSELWAEAGRLGFLGVNLPEEYGGGGAGIYELSLVEEELAAQGCGLLLMVVSQAINGTIISRFGTDEQKRQWLPGIASGEMITSFAITEADAGSNSHQITSTARRVGDEWVLRGQKTYISGVDQSAATLVVAKVEGAQGDRLRPALFLVPTDAKGYERTPMHMGLHLPESQFQVFFDDVRLPADALIGSPEAGMAPLFAGLNPERIMGAAMSTGWARFAMDKAVGYAKSRSVFGAPIGSRQGLSHPLADCKIQVELAKLMMQKAARLYDSGRDDIAGEPANMAKYAAAEAAIRTVDQAIQVHGGAGLSQEVELINLLGVTRLNRIAPVSREMVLNYVAHNSLGLPRSY
ncbi:acyl-CoA dehydrogenase family protein [Dietzia kunjamensis]|uniref:acyl-CoA dehydrogenase family protein n=1 Tax=Dietzia kunjamensis TaxID=322509 RepID=UPI0033666968